MVEKKKTETGKEEQRIVLNLNLEQAQTLSKACFDARLNTIYVEKQNILKNISNRIDKTILKQKVLKEFEKQGIKPTKEQMKKAMETAK